MAHNEATSGDRADDWTYEGEHRLERNRLRGTIEYAINPIMSVAEMGFGKLLGWIGRLGLYFRTLMVAIFSVSLPDPVFWGGFFRID